MLSLLSGEDVMSNTYFRRNTLLGNNLPYLMQHNSAPVEDGLIESLQSSSIQDIPVNRRHILNQRVYRRLIVLTHLHIKRGDPDSDVDESWHTILGQKHYCIYCLTVLTKQEWLGVDEKSRTKKEISDSTKSMISGLWETRENFVFHSFCMKWTLFK